LEEARELLTLGIQLQVVQGYVAPEALVPQEKLCVSELANVTRDWPGAVTEHITNAILAKLLGRAPCIGPTTKLKALACSLCRLRRWFSVSVRASLWYTYPDGTMVAWQNPTSSVAGIAHRSCC
jgi:hypothetical protein